MTRSDAQGRADTKVAETRDFYDDALRDALEGLWGEHLHLALFDRPGEPIETALERATATMADGLDLTTESQVLEVACGVGAAARHLARRYGCRVLATNISTRQLVLGRALTETAGLAHLVRFAEADFHALDQPDASLDLWWCQEALLHSPDKKKVLAEAHRVLKPGGRLVLSDLTVPVGTAAADRARIYERVQSPGMWDRADYDTALAALGFEVVRCRDWSEHVAPTYATMHKRTLEQRPALKDKVPLAELDELIAQLATWVACAQAGKIGWLYYLARK